MSREEEPGEGTDRLFDVEQGSAAHNHQLKETPEEQMCLSEVPAVHRWVGVMLLWLC